MIDSEKTNEAAEESDAGEKRGIVAGAVYSTCYYLSYGVCFPTMLAASVVPADSVVAHGFSDGAGAAKEGVDKVRDGASEAYATVARQFGETVESIEDKFAERRHKKQQRLAVEQA